MLVGMETCSSDEGCDQPASAKGLCPKHYARALRERKRVERLPEPRECLRCGVVFTAKNARQVYCGQPCIQAAYRDRQRDQSEPISERTCLHCGKVFTPRKRHSDADPWQRGKFCSQKCKERARQADGRSGATVRRYQFRTKYGITVEEYWALAEAQGHRCAICGCTKETAMRGRVSQHTDEFWLHVDHDHESGKVRGLLCMECNTGLGKFRDDVSVLSAAISYLRGCKL